MRNTELLAAQKILLRVVQDKIPYKQSFTKDTTPLTKEICFGVCRNYYSLENTAEEFVQKKPKDLRVWLVILIGIYQLRFLNTPQYAVVKETVELLQKTWEKNFVNAVLRSYLRKQDKNNQNSSNPQVIYNHPLWLITKIKKSWPKNWQKILLANNQHPPLSIRVNTQKLSVDAYLSLLKQANIPAEVSTISPSGIIITTPVKVNDLPGFAEGLVSVQDLAAQLAVKFLDLKPSFKVLDACAAPGGKTCHILESEPNLQSCLAIDISANRAKKITENLTRLNLKADIKICDCLEIEKWWDGEYFDRILLDAPCSATGVIRRNPDIKLLRTENEISLIVELQKKILTKLWSTLKPGGKLIYTTCSILPEENTKQIANFLKTQKDCKCLEIISDKSPKEEQQFGLQILSGENNMDGFFYSVLAKET